MPGIQTIRSEVQRLRRAVPFRPFALTLENGDWVVIEHPENIAFDPSLPENTPGACDFYAFSNQLRVFSTFSAVTGVAVVD